jgi:hypothetical protein
MTEIKDDLPPVIGVFAGMVAMHEKLIEQTGAFD